MNGLDDRLARLHQPREEDDHCRLVERPLAVLDVRHAPARVDVNLAKKVVGELVDHRRVRLESAEGVTLHQPEDLRLSAVEDVRTRRLPALVGRIHRLECSARHVVGQVDLPLRATAHVALREVGSGGGALAVRRVLELLNRLPKLDVLLRVLLCELLLHPLPARLCLQHIVEVEADAHADHTPELVVRQRAGAVLVEHGEACVDLLDGR
mmetsp:Transcript_2948/g.7813  ORF Transcript_2948/g.7813 Transcript_2948/m.7813 type:complete len:210 (-) Transcript_2948:412-1041(-)